MKQIEKLAEEWLLPDGYFNRAFLRNDSNDLCERAALTGFEAGFRKGRELIREAIRTSGREGFDDWLLLKDFGEQVVE